MSGQVRQLAEQPTRGWAAVRALRGWPLAVIAVACAVLPGLVAAALSGRLLGAHVRHPAYVELSSRLGWRTVGLGLEVAFCLAFGLRVVGRRRLWNRRLIPLGLIVAIGFVMGVATLVSGDLRPATSLWQLAGGALLVGAFEETLFRGIVLNAVHVRHPAAVAVLGSSAVFGLAHSTNLVVGHTAQEVATQVTIAFMFGTVIGWTYLFSGRNLPLVIAAHALYDFGLSFPSATVGAPVGYQIAAGLLLIPVLPTSFIVLTVIGVRRLDLPVAILTAPDQQAVDA